MIRLDSSGYGDFCPISTASEVLCRRWTPLILREFMCGSTRFSELRRGLPRLSPTLLSTRLKQLEAEGLIEQMTDEAGTRRYALTPAGRELKPVILGLGEWGLKWIEKSTSLSNLDASLLMLDVHRTLRPEPAPPRRAVVQFLYRDRPKKEQRWWMTVEGNGVDVCNIDPGHDVDLFAVTDLRTMTAVWMGYTSIHEELQSQRLRLEGSENLQRLLTQWFEGHVAFGAMKRD